MAQQTAVEWLMYRIKNQHLYDFKSLNELEEQAKQMEKEQIVEAYNEGCGKTEWTWAPYSYYSKKYNK